MTYGQASAERPPLKVDPAVAELISQGAHFLGVTKEDLVAEAVKDYLAARREEIHRRMTEAMSVLDGSTKSRLALLTGVSPEDIDRLGGIQEYLNPHPRSETQPSAEES